MIRPLRLLALDLSLTASGYATVVTGESPAALGTITPKSRGEERLQSIRNRVLELARGADVVLVEGYAFGRANQAHQMGELGGVVRLALYEAGLPFVEVPPSLLKSYATGRGNAGKADVLVAAVKRLGYEGANDNEADAFWLLHMAADHYGAPWAQLPEAQRAALKKVVWPEIPKPCEVA